jgi:hypothetical protein
VRPKFTLPPRVMTDNHTCGPANDRATTTKCYYHSMHKTVLCVVLHTAQCTTTHRRFAMVSLPEPTAENFSGTLSLIYRVLELVLFSLVDSSQSPPAAGDRHAGVVCQPTTRRVASCLAVRSPAAPHSCAPRTACACRVADWPRLISWFTSA